MALTFTAGPVYEATAGGTSGVLTLPSGFVDGDYILLTVAYVASTGVIDAPAGYTALLPTTDTSSGSTAGHHAIFYKKWASGDGNPTVTVTSTGRIAGFAVKVSGADPTTFVDTAASVQQAPTTQTVVTAPSITPTSTVLVASFMARSGTNGVTFTFSTPTGMTAVASASSNVASASNGAVFLATETVPAGVATGTRASTLSSNVTGAMGVSFALKEAEAAPAQGTASGSWSFTGTATGATAKAGTASGSWAFTGSATGTAPAIGANSGTATGTWSFTGTAAGSTSRTGTASGSWGFTGTAAGAAPSTAPPTHAYGYATLTPATGTAVLAGNGTSTAAVTGGTVGGFGLDFGLSFGAFTVMGPVTATITPTAPGTAELHLD